MRRGRLALIVAAVGVVVFGGLVFRDIQRIDPTSGGYSAPYSDFTGEPIDWSTHRVTESGFRDDGGTVLNTSLDCTTGQIRGHLGFITFDYRKLSDRAIVVHEPHIACMEAGFEPEWDHPSSDVTTAEASRG